MRATYSSQKHNYHQRGYTLIELILYMGITALVTTALVQIGWNLVFTQNKGLQESIVKTEAEQTLSTLLRLIQTSDSALIVSSHSLELTQQAQVTQIDLLGESIHLTLPGSPSTALTSNQVRVTQLDFTQINQASPNTQHIQVSLTLEQASQNLSAHAQAVSSLSSSVEVLGSFNQARQVLVDFTALNNSTYPEVVEGITLENIGSQAVTIDQITVSWDNPQPSQQLALIQIDGGPQEWSGTANGGSQLDISDYTLGSSTTIAIDSLSFNTDVSNWDISLVFQLLDGSHLHTQFQVPAGISPTPTPTPTPLVTPTPTPSVPPTPSPVPTSTPNPTTCAQYCQQATYTSGNCRKNAQACTKANETYQSGGNYLCTGGPHTDTCCCVP